MVHLGTVCQLLGGWGLVRGGGQIVELRQHDHPGDLKGSGVDRGAAAVDVCPEFRGGERGEVRRVARGDRDAVVGVENVLHAVETLGRQLVVCEAAQQLADQDVDLAKGAVGQGGAFPGAHVRLDDGDAAAPGVDVASLQQNIGVGVLFNGVDLDGHAAASAGVEGARDERAAARADDSHDDGAVVRAGRLFLGVPILQGLGSGALVPGILDGVLFEDFVGDGLEVVGQGLQRALQVVLEASAEALDLALWGLIALEVAEVAQVRGGVAAAAAGGLGGLFVQLGGLGGGGLGERVSVLGGGGGQMAGRVGHDHVGVVDARQRANV